MVRKTKIYTPMSDLKQPGGKESRRDKTENNDFVEAQRVKKQRVVTEEHHRRPRSLEGSNAPANISYIEKRKHDAWHILVGNMNVYQIAEYFNETPYKPENIKIRCELINGSEVKKEGENNSKNMSKIKKAWNILFVDCENFEQIIAYVNSVLLDPSYHLYLEKK